MFKEQVCETIGKRCSVEAKRIGLLSRWSRSGEYGALWSEVFEGGELFTATFGVGLG
ncbi:MAG: hypothetical protein RMJ84_05510 [Sandaracinaceae bacterium]|nr:hypothetical protein [Sandaracinaceae bacterium]